MDVMYTLSQSGFSIDNNTESKDMMYWYSAYVKDMEKAKNEKQKVTNKIITRR